MTLKKKRNQLTSNILRIRPRLSERREVAMTNVAVLAKRD